MQSLLNNSLKSYSKSLLTKTVGSSLLSTPAVSQIKKLSTLGQGKTTSLNVKRAYESKANYGKPDSSEKVN